MPQPPVREIEYPAPANVPESFDSWPKRQADTAWEWAECVTAQIFANLNAPESPPLDNDVKTSV
jgi:hypothetical protein